MGNIVRDLRYSLRTLRKNPGFTVVAVIALALGIGVNTSIFSLYNALALRPLPVKDPGRVVRLFQTHFGESGAGVFSYPEYVDYRDRNPVLSGVAAWSWASAVMGSGDRVEDVKAMFVSGNYFDVLRADTAAGRTFVPEEDRTPDSHPVVVLSYGFWERRFARDPAVVGRTILLNGNPFTVVGVVARNFVGTDVEAPEIWLPIMMSATIAPERGTGIFQDRNGHWLQVIGRLKPGVSWAQAQASMDVLARQLAQSYSEEKNSGVLLATATFLPPNVEKVSKPIVALVMGAVGLVLLIACANVANLLLARATARQKEIGLRLSLGATRWRLVRQLLTESLVVSLLSGVAGLLLAAWSSSVLMRLLTPPFTGTLNFNVRPDLRVLGYAFAVSLATGIIFGLVPAFHASKPGVNDLIKSKGRRAWASDLFVVAQVGLCAILLVAAGLLLRALGRAQTTDPGFDTEHVVALSLDMRLHHYDTAAAVAFERRVADRLRSTPGVKTVSLAATVPLGSADMATSVVIEGHEPKPDAPPLIVGQDVVSPDFFETLGISVLRGRGFQDADWNKGPEVVIINETMARRFWPGQEAIGKRLRVGDSKEYAEIVGVVKETRSTYLWETDELYLYSPAKAENNPGPDLKILVRAAGNAQALMGALAGVVRELDRGVQVSVKPLDENLEIWIWPSKVGATLAAAFGLLALTLAAVGIYGVVAYTVGRRTHEIGIHVALGAQRGDVLRKVLGHGVVLVAAGGTAGLATGFAISRLLAKFLYGLPAGDPVTFSAVAASLVAVALIANYVPARRALRVDPMVALRHE
jgi:putative ABC transport system permease protein